jgi:hypothetical protein
MDLLLSMDVCVWPFLAKCGGFVHDYNFAETGMDCLLGHFAIRKSLQFS